MKTIKFIALMLVVLVSMTACINDGKEDRTVINTYGGYVYASFFFSQNYYSGTGEVKVKVKNGVCTITVKSDEWGEGTFEKVAVGDNISGTGTMSIPNEHTGDVKEYTDAELSGTLTDLVIRIPSCRMGQMDTEGTTLYFHIGRIPSEKVAGTFSGINSVEVGQTWTYTTAEEISCEITTNEDGTINLILPEYQLTGTDVGDLTLGGYTISNIAFNRDLGVFQSYYASDDMKEHFKMEKNGTVVKDDEYAFGSSSKITIEPVKKSTKTTVKVTNDFTLGKIEDGAFKTAMPWGLVATFTGTIPSAK